MVHLNGGGLPSIRSVMPIVSGVSASQITTAPSLDPANPRHARVQIARPGIAVRRARSYAALIAPVAIRSRGCGTERIRSSVHAERRSSPGGHAGRVRARAPPEARRVCRRVALGAGLTVLGLLLALTSTKYS